MTTTLVAEKYSIRNTSTVELMMREMIHSLFDVLTEDNGREVSWSLTSLFSTNTAISETNNGREQYVLQSSEHEVLDSTCHFWQRLTTE